MRSAAASTENSMDYSTVFLMHNHFSRKKSKIIDLISQSKLNNKNSNILSVHKKYFINLFRIQLKRRICNNELNNNDKNNLPVIPYNQKSYKLIEKNNSSHKIKHTKKLIKIDNDADNKMKTFFVKRLLHSKSNKDNNQNDLILTKVKQQINNTFSNFYGLNKQNFTPKKSKIYSISKTKYKSLSTEVRKEVPKKYKGLSRSEVRKIFLKKKLNKDLLTIQNLKEKINLYQKKIINKFQSISDNVASIYEHENVNN